MSQCISVLRHYRHKEQRSVTAPSYSCNQAGLCPRSGAQSVSSHKAQGFYIAALLSRVWTIFPGSASFGWPTVQFVRCDCIRPEGGKGTKAVKLGCCVFLCRICQAAVTTTTMQCLPKRCKSLTVGGKKEKTHYPNVIKTPNDKSCLASRWIIVMLVAYVHTVCGD